MREIKFRAWNSFDGEENKMVYFDFKTIYQEGYFDSDNRISPYWSHEDEIIMQYTGLKDKNEKEIYEGDIVKSWLSRTPEEFEVDLIEDIRECNHLKSGHAFDNAWIEFEIIGNIYENPELLEKINE